MIGLIYLTGFALYFLIGLGFSILYYRRSKRKNRKIILIVFLLVYLSFPWADMFLKSAVITARTFNIDLQEIRETVKSPESVLWVDNVWPGYNDYGRYGMVRAYLDGVHLKTLAIYGDDGKYYLYHASIEDFTESEKLRFKYDQLMQEKNALEKQARQAGFRRELENENNLWRIVKEEYEPKIKAVSYYQKRKEEVERIFYREEVFANIEDLPPLKYRVEFNPIPVTTIEKKLLWADEIKIISNQNNKIIAYSKRYLSYGSWIGFHPRKSLRMGIKKGDIQPYEFDDKVLFGYAEYNSPWWSRNFLEKSTYQLGALNWKHNR